MPTIDVAYITNLCQKLYFPAEEYTIATFITAHVSLFYLFRDMTGADAKAQNFTLVEIEDIVTTCSKNAETAMRNVRLFMEANYENIEAVLLAVRICSPSGMWPASHY